MPVPLLHRLIALGRAAARSFRRRLLAATRPAVVPLAIGTLTDLTRSESALVAENALLRHQRSILRRSVGRPRCTPVDRALPVLPIVQPATLLRWHRALSRGHWRRQSRAAAPAHRPPLAPETGTPIREMAVANRTRGAERIRGELPKLGIRVAKSTVQKYAREAHPPRRAGQPHTISTPGTSSVTTTASTGGLRAGRGGEPQHRVADGVPRPDRTRRASGSRAACGGNASIVSSSRAGRACDAFSVSMSCTSTATGRTRAWRDRFPKQPRQRHCAASGAAGCAPPRSRVASITPMREPRNARWIGLSATTGSGTPRAQRYRGDARYLQPRHPDDGARRRAAAGRGFQRRSSG